MWRNSFLGPFQYAIHDAELGMLDALASYHVRHLYYGDAVELLGNARHVAAHEVTKLDENFFDDTWKAY
jgi:hypothetical protein